VPGGLVVLPVSRPGFAGIGNNSAEASYYTWVDQHNTLGLGDDVPISTGNENDALLALVKGKWVVIRVPYPLGFYAKGLDGRIDDPNGGGLGAASGPPAATARPGSRKAARAPPPSPSTSSCAQPARRLSRPRVALRVSREDFATVDPPVPALTPTLSPPAGRGRDPREAWEGEGRAPRWPHDRKLL